MAANPLTPVADLIDRLAHLSIDELIGERRRLERVRYRDKGRLGVDDYHRLAAVCALILRHEQEFHMTDQQRTAVWVQASKRRRRNSLRRNGQNAGHEHASKRCPIPGD